MSKADRQKNNLKKTILQYIEGKRYEKLGVAALLKRLKIHPSLQNVAKEVILELIQEGVIELVHKQILLKKPPENFMAGLLRAHPRGFGFVLPKDKIAYPKDVFIPKNFMGGAIDGDEVEVEVLESSLSSEKGPEGKVRKILKRGRQHLTGIVKELGSQESAEIYAPILGQGKTIFAKLHGKEKVKSGDRVIIQIEKWGSETSPTEGKIVQHLGHISDPSIDIKAAIEEFELKNTFPDDVIALAKTFGSRVHPKELTERKDLRKMISFTIDPKTARDFDDALSLSKDSKGYFHLGVHIADVAHYVEEGSSIDKEALLRCNSTYFPGACIPMLPESLSNNLCSLKANVLRLTVSVLMTFNAKGELVEHETVRSVIKSCKRFTYEEAKAVIDGRKKSVHKSTLDLMVELCLLLKEQRRARGSIDFSLDETVIQVNEKGEPTGFAISEYDISHQLVEEFMLKANEVVALSLTKKGLSLVFRTHEDPGVENIEEFASFARSLGFFVPGSPSKKDLQKLFDEAKTSPFLHTLTVSFIRSMKLATYSRDNIGHYGLSLEHYCHFTSPIRRYSDLIIQRLLFGKCYDDKKLEAIASDCSDQERVSFRAEMSVKQLKKLRFLHAFYEKNPKHIYEVTITKVKPFGISFEIPPMMLEGFLHISDLENDYFVYDEKRGILVGRRSGIVHATGKKLEVELTHIDFVVQETKWRLSQSTRRKKHS